MGVYLTGISEADLQNIIMDYDIDVVQIKRDYDIKAISVEEPHGRLIDADAEYKALSEMKVEGEVFVTAVEFAKIQMEQAPTVIEAEVE